MILPHIRKMSPYKPPIERRSAKNYLLLDFNERTTPVSAGVKNAILDFVRRDRLQVYPEYGDFLDRLAGYTGVSSSELMITNGSDQGIEIIFRSVAVPGNQAIVPLPTFDMLRHSAELCALELVCPAYTRNEGYPFREVVQAITDSTKIIVVCNPNSPTGTLLKCDRVLELAKLAPHAAILVDECYFEYSGVSVKDFINDYPNIFITRTFSKTWGLSALRLGYIISSAANIEELLKVRGPYDMNTIAVVAAKAALDEPEFMKSYVDEVVHVSRPMLLEALAALDLPFWPTESNFVLIHPPDGQELVQLFHEEGILVRPRKGPGIDGSVRITVGTREDTERVIEILRNRYGEKDG